jgi:uncharacterized protein GlcG (DUF336 family)
MQIRNTLLNGPLGFGGGVPVVFDGTILGAVGASAGTVEQDVEAAEAAIAAIDH